MSKPTMVKLDAVMVKEGVGKVDISFRYDPADESSCYVSFKAKTKKKGKRASQPIEEVIVNDNSVTYKGDGVYIIPFHQISSVQSLPAPNHRFRIGTKSQSAHIFTTTKKVRKRWVDTITKNLNDFKQNQGIGIRATLRSQAGVFSNTMQFRGKTQVVGNNASRGRIGSSRTLGSNRDNLDVFKSPQIGKSMKSRHSKTTGRGQTQFQALSKTARKTQSHKFQEEASDVSKQEVFAPPSKPTLDQFYTDNKTITRKLSRQPAPPAVPPPLTKVFQTYLKPKPTIIKSDEIETLNRKAVMPVFDDDGVNRDYAKTEKDLKFLRDTIRSSNTIQTLVAYNFDDRALEQLIEKMFQQNFLEDERILEAGDKVNFLYILEKGVFVQSIPGTSHSVKRAAKGSTYGELQLKYGTSSTFTVMCKKPCRFWCIARQDYLEIAKWNSKRNQHLRIEALKSVETFKKTLSPADFHALATSLDMNFATEGEIVLEYANEVNNVIIVAQGEIHLYGQNDQYPRAKLEKGDHFGMLGLFEPVISKFRLVVADRKTVYFSLRIKEFDEIFGGMKSVIEAAMKQAELRGKKTAMVMRKPLTIQHELHKVRQTMSTLASLPVISQSHTMAPPSIRSITMTVPDFDEDTDDDEVSVEEQVDFPFLECPPLLPSLQYSDLEVLNLINKGNFGHVYTVRYKGFQNPKSKALKIQVSPHENKTYAFPDYAPIGFALKIMPRHKITKNGWQDKVDNEVLAMAEVSYYCRSPFIIQLYHSFCCPKFIHLLIELGEGGDLYALVRGQPEHRLDERAARYYLACVVNGLDVLHQRKILYRDLKPENLILNNKGHLKVADLGLAKKTTRTSTQCGTPEYTAPEVIANLGHDHSCDWWAVGVLVYELHYGETPFFASRATKIYDNIENHRSPIRFYDERNPPGKKNKKYGFLKGKYSFSNECKDLIGKFLVPKGSLRLGYVKPGAEKVRLHPYFSNHSSFSWARLAHLREVPPFVIDLPDEDKMENLEQDPDVRYVNERRKDQSGWEPKVNTILQSTPQMQGY